MDGDGKNEKVLNSILKNQMSGSHSIDIDMARRLAYKLADDKKPHGAKIKSVDVNFLYVVNLDWMVQISIEYESIGHRGIPIIVPNNFTILLKDLVSLNVSRRPVVPIR